jgi:hypothetical protein
MIVIAIVFSLLSGPEVGISNHFIFKALIFWEKVKVWWVFEN